MLLKLLKIAANSILRPLGQEIGPVPPPQGKHSDPGPQPFYRVSKTCQIRGMGYLYEKFFGNRKNGVFVEVGAFDGESYSNTSCLADAGWHGHYIEPIPEYHAKCAERHAGNRNTKVHNLGIGDREGVMHLNLGGPMTTANPEHLEAYLGLDWAKGDFNGTRLVKARQMTLDGFLKEQSIHPGFEVLVIDVEGYEPAVFAGLSLDKWRPIMLIVELGDTKSDLPHFQGQYAALYKMICANGYYVVYKDAINSVFVDARHYSRTFALEN
jgi:FkbM family methyltransferase